MDVTFSEDTSSLDIDVVALPIAAGEALDGLALTLDQTVDGLIGNALRAREHRGRLHEVLPLPVGGRQLVRRVLLYGLGAPEDLDGQRMRFAHHEMVRAARSYGYRRVGVVCSGAVRREHLGDVIEGCVLGTWDRRGWEGGGGAGLQELRLVGFGAGREEEATFARMLGEATNQARDWQQAPGNAFGPDELCRAGSEIARRHGLELEVMGDAELEAEGCRLLLAVGRGSDRPTRLLRLHYHGAPGRGRTLALLGKGITFDSGGLSLKTRAGMETMRGDMAGAAAVLAAIDVIAARRMPLDVMAVVPAAENLTGASAQRVGDVWRSASGKTVEIVDTDCEGRLALADAITVAIRRGATHLVDLATLTGTAARALGHAATPALSSDPALWQLVQSAAQAAGERIWPLPVYPEYRTLLRSPSADLRNSGYGEASTIIAGMFLQEFTEGRPWVHLDIAASSWNDNAQLGAIPRGPLGSGTRTCVRLAELFAAEGR